MRGSDVKLCFSEKERGKVCVNRDDMVQMLKEFKIGSSVVSSKLISASG